MSNPRQLKTSSYEVDPRQLRLLTEQQNAHYMTADQMKTLTRNLRRDGTLTSVPLIYRYNPDSDELPTVISGNHRVRGAIAAGIQSILVMEVLTRLSDEEIRAIQLSHNAIMGQDDPSILERLYDSLSLPEKLYSGLTDDQFKIEPIDISSLSIGSPTYQEIVLSFLPAEAEEFLALVKRVKKRANLPATLLLQYSDFGKVFDTVVSVKENLNVYNTAVAFRVLVDLAMERLAQIKDATDASEEKQQNTNS